MSSTTGILKLKRMALFSVFVQAILTESEPILIKINIVLSNSTIFDLHEPWLWFCFSFFFFFY